MTAQQITATAGRRSRIGIAAAGGAVALAALHGWGLFLFLTDDAYIEFRYAANVVAGHGFVWNAAPFLPVEGYTSFLWVALLAAVWAVSGLEPPETANLLSLGFGLVSLGLVGLFLRRLRLPPGLEGWRPALAALVFAGILANRTFLTWLSSGLETALFNACLTWWVYEACTPCDRRGGAWGWRLALAAALTALARPDGLLAVAGTAVILAAETAWTWRGSRAAAGRLAAAAPLLLVPAHVLWRKWYYGAWLPNTYYAKSVQPWPEMGLLYAGSFVVEYGVWIWLALAAAWLAVQAGRLAAVGRPGVLAAARRHHAAVVAVGVLAGHVGYYTLIIGGDHFEYRVYSPHVPLLFLSALAMLAALTERRAVAAGVLGAFVLASLPVPWTHWALTRDRDTRAATHMMTVPVAPSFPAPLRPLLAEWDGWQARMIGHLVGVRHQEHKVFAQFQAMLMPPRAEGAAIGRDGGNPVAVFSTVGVPGWALPNVAIIDWHGLNDRVIARTPPPPERLRHRLMAHDREPPPGYVACFEPDVAFPWLREHREQAARIPLPATAPAPLEEIRRVQRTPRAAPLLDERLRRCERDFGATTRK